MRAPHLHSALRRFCLGSFAFFGREIAEGAGELGFYPPSSKWPLFLSLTFVPVVIAPIYGWWLMVIGFGFGFFTLTGLLYEFYRGDHAH